MNSLFAPWELANHTSSPWHIAAWTMCYFLIFGTAVAIAGAAIRFLINRAAPALRYAVSLAVFAALSILPVGIAIWLAQSPQVKLISVVPSTTIDLAEIPEFTHPLELDTEPLSSPTAPAPTPFASTLLAQKAQPVQESDAVWFIVYLPWLWIAGAPITFALLATGLVGSERLRRRCEPVASGIVLETAQRARASLNLTRKVSVVICDRIVQPVLIGIVRPLILLPPTALTGWSPEELEMVLLHELAHVRRWDNLVNLAQRLVESLLFFHPAVWLVSRRVRLDREECCDAVVVAQTAAPQAYAELLVSIAAKGSLTPSLATASAMADHPLTSRIRRILHLEEEKMLVTRSTLGLVGLFFVAMLGMVLWQPAPATVAQETDATVAPDLAEVSTLGSKNNEKNKDLEDVKREITIKRVFDIPMPIAFASPDAHEAWKQTQFALIKSTFVLREAIQRMAKDKESYAPPTVLWLQQRLKVRLVGKNLVLEIRGHVGKDPSQAMNRLDYFAETVMKSYLQEREAHTKLVEAERSTHALLDRDRTNSKNAPPAIPVFLSLEDQKLADLAYKLLGVELEQLGVEELVRVKAMKFAGGLRVTADRSRYQALGVDSLLVGLHIWPTKSLEDIAKVLQRDDIAELSPLKFYVIRRQASEESEYGVGGRGREMVDKLVTGRIEVNLDAVASKMQSRFAISPPTLRHTPVFAPMPVNPNSPIFLNGPAEAPPSTRGVVPPSSAYPSKSPNPKGKPTLLYDGKTFEQWREMWKTELKVEKRTECVNALAAFARAGHAKEAAETILDVAGEYDFTSIGNSLEGKLKQSVSNTLSKNIPISQWLTSLLERYDTDEEKWGKLTRWLLQITEITDENSRQRILEIANSDHSLRETATQVLIQTDRDLERPETVELARKALQGEHPNLSALSALGFRHLDQVPEQFDLLFHSDRNVRHAARSVFPINRIPQEIERKLFDVLYDPDQSEKHLFAIRAFSAPTNYANPGPTKDLLLRIAREGDKQLLGAALFGLTKVMSVPDPVVLEVVAQEDLDEDRKKLVSEDGLTILLQEKFHMTQGGGQTGGGF